MEHECLYSKVTLSRELGRCRIELSLERMIMLKENVRKIWATSIPCFIEWRVCVLGHVPVEVKRGEIAFFSAKVSFIFNKICS